MRKERQSEETHPVVLAKGAVFPVEQRVEEAQCSAAQRQWKQLDWQRVKMHQEVQVLLRKAMLFQSVKQQVMVRQWTLELLLQEEYLGQIVAQE